ncbi:hypothetical protein EVAR_79978_1 [Eumeta japonica]|uniref:Uncharacterized protein n=1 Tax=Eumeta variegata TaxID=151549 RepID=A0A4C2A7G0_EUMVA|nr:hypothetical protein EVAR_79978_1 [Eumeta japonica]
MVAIHGEEKRRRKIGARRPQYGKSDDGRRPAVADDLRERPRTDEPAPAASGTAAAVPVSVPNAVRDAYTRNTRWYL